MRMLAYKSNKPGSSQLIGKNLPDVKILLQENIRLVDNQNFSVNPKYETKVKTSIFCIIMLIINSAC